MRSDLDLAACAKENIQHKVGTNLRMFINRLHTDFPPHWHNDVEIIWPKEAPYKVVCSNQTYDVEIDDILLICPAVLHEIFSPTPGSRIYIQADFSGIISLKEIDKAFRLMSPALHIKKKTCPPEIYSKVCDYLNKIMELYFGSAPPIRLRDGEKDDENVVLFSELPLYGELEIYSILLEFIAFCCKNISTFRESDSVSVSSAYKNTISLSNVCSYISEHFAENISLESIATYAGFSKYHFERIFSEYAGMTFYQYLQQMRINYAQTLLSNPELSITDISFQAGFASCTAFTRAFKKSTGYPPSQFRMLNEAKHPLTANPYFAKT
ncbi:AraC-type DNA-binding protein [Butyrivibrio sp. INlla18]|uniref:helix-turn-helix transcriptional regulator n=1 Tax=Butyrivibrio sp. INlla18 TaxID=1520806 RepID=UPI000891C973|nr:AraC family transcriptional regulator [Butyrivibrio sp. INlla18]SDA75933.1 AraC-type DNA-binding protein [Butyrivibrio sp. INlla18]